MSNLCKRMLLAILAIPLLISIVIAAPAAEAVQYEPDFKRDGSLLRRTCTYPLSLGSPTNGFSLLSYIKISNTGTTLSIKGNIGVNPSGTIVNIPTASVTGTEYINDASASAAIATASATCSCAAAALPRTTQMGTSITGVTFTPGAYFYSGAVNLAASGTTTFNAKNNASAQFIIIMEGALTTGASSTIALINGAKACNVFWTVGAPPSAGAAVTLGATSTFNGILCGYGAITVGANCVVNGLLITLLDTASAILAIAGGTFKAVTTC